MKVTQIMCAAGAMDAVTNQALAWRAQFREWGWDGEDFSASSEPDVKRNRLRPLRDFEPNGELVLLHYSGYVKDLDRLLPGSTRTLLLSHNVTPDEWFWPYDPLAAVRCRLAREQLHDLARHADRLAGVSAYNSQELEEASGRPADVIPVLFDPGDLGAPGNRTPASSGPTILFVGRLTPHKRQDLLLRALAAYRRTEPAARLVLVGGPLTPAYGERLSRLADELAPGAVSFQSGISAGELADRYRAADVFLCLSEHEGFCIPILEALHFGVPVIARDAAAVGETIGDAGVLLGPDDDVETIAELLSIVVSDGELREELRRRGERRLARFDQRATAERMRSALVELGQ